MGRKDLLKGLMDQDADAAPRKSAGTGAGTGAASAAKPRTQKGAIGAVSQSIAELKSRSVTDLDPTLIDAGGLQDRLDHNDADHASLVASLREYGQQVPVLVRPHPEAEGRYQVVYGRRRILALRDLGAPVKAMIRDLDDRAVVMAQGQENSARRDLSFIEKVNFARQMRDADYDRKIISDALDIDKTLISRMLSIADHVPVGVIEAIGPAPSIGRDRWLTLAGLIERRDWEEPALRALASGDSSDKRFEALLHALTGPDRRAAEAEKHKAERETPEELQTDSGRRLGEVKRAKGKLTLTFKAKDAAGFEQWLVDNMTEIHRDWITRSGE